MTPPRLVIVFLLVLVRVPADAQTKPAPPPPQPGSPQKPAPKPPAKPAPQTTKPAAPRNPSPISARAFATLGGVMFQAQDSFDAILGSHTGSTFGGGGQVLLPKGLYAEAAVWRFTRDGERAFVGPGREVFRLGIPLTVTLTPVEITGGWRYRHCPQPRRPPQKPGAPRAPQPRVTPTRPCAPKVIPYVGGGLSSFKYTETSEFESTNEDVDDRFNGFHVVGGAEYRLMRWVAVGGELAWSSLAEALGDGGVSAAFNEDNLGGATFRLKITVGR
jgi:hypothetical protein